MPPRPFRGAGPTECAKRLETLQVCILAQMKIMSVSKERETQQQSYFYVVWPEDKSPGSGAASIPATPAALSSTAVNSSAATTSSTVSSSSAPILSFNYDTQTVPASNSSNSTICSTTSLQQGSPMTQDADASMASEEVVTSANVLQSQDTSTGAHSTVYSHSNGIKSLQPVQHLPTPVPSCGSMTVSVLPPFDTFTATTSSIGRQRTVLTPDVAHFGRPRVPHGSPSGGDMNLREIGDHLS